MPCIKSGTELIQFLRFVPIYSCSSSAINIPILHAYYNFAINLLNIDNDIFNSIVNLIYPSELQLYKVNVSDTEASFLDLHLSISDGFVETKIYDKRDDFNFDIVNFPSRW